MKIDLTDKVEISLRGTAVILRRWEGEKYREGDASVGGSVTWAILPDDEAGWFISLRASADAAIRVPGGRWETLETVVAQSGERTTSLSSAVGITNARTAAIARDVEVAVEKLIEEVRARN